MERSDLHIGEVTLSVDEAEEVLSAIRHGHVDAVMVKDGDGEQVYTFRDPSHPYRVLLETMPEAAAMATLDGLICYHNPHFGELLESDGGSLTGTLLSELVAPEDAAKVDALLIEARSHTVRADATLLGVDGGRRPVLLSLSTAALAEIPVFCVIATDAREHNRQQELYRAARLEIEERDRMLSVAAHELRGTLSALVLHSDLIQMNTRLDDVGTARMQKSARSIGVHARHLADLVTTLLDVGSIGTGRLRLEVEQADLAEIVADVHVRCEDTIRLSGSPMTLDLRPAPGRWDRTRVAQVVMNLLTNAAKYGAGQPITVRVDAEDGLGRLVVEDRGPGIPLADRERIFRPYERMASGSAIPGLGLGLYITAEIVKAHGGAIWVESAPDSGARFVVELPLDASVTSP